VPVDPERERRVRVPELVHHRAGIHAERHEERREGVPELMWRQPFRQRNFALLFYLSCPASLRRRALGG
jgi:hypothetical protein